MTRLTVQADLVHSRARRQADEGDEHDQREDEREADGRGADHAGLPAEGRLAEQSERYRARQRGEDFERGQV